jgi:glycosyltransferase involved in cell wall biosynthesis
VVIPTYDRSEYLPKAIESVAAQTYERIELVLVDDGSPRPAIEMLAVGAFDGLDSVTTIRHTENHGANVARNNGIRAATGEYIAFLDDDDYWDETKLARQVEVFERSGPEVGVVYTGVRAEGSTGRTVKIPDVEGDVLKHLLLGESFGQFSSVIVKADVIDEVGLPDERFPAWQDRDWFLRLAKQYHFGVVAEPLTHRRTGLPDSITRKFERKRDVAYPLFIEKHYQVARDHGWYCARTFLASLRRTLGRSALVAGKHRAARKWFLLAFLANPLYRPVYGYLLALLGGELTYKPAALLRQKLQSYGNPVG